MPKLSPKFSTAVKIKVNGGTLNDLLDALVGQYGALVKEELLNTNGRLRGGIQVLTQNRTVINREYFETHEIRQDDEITFMKFIGGG